MRLNTAPRFTEKTHEGAPAARMNTEQALRRSVCSCLLWENEFYEDGISIADRITTLARKVAPATLAALAIEARNQLNLRHVPLLLLSVLAETASGGRPAAETIPEVIKRADELAEFLVVHAVRNGTTPDKVKSTISKQMKLGLAKAFRNFDAYQLAKYDRPGQIRLRDVLFLVHPKPENPEQKALWKQLVDGTLSNPDTWESALAGGADKKETFTRLLSEQKLGYMALLRNLRNMDEAGVDPQLIKEAILARRGAQRVLPFRYVAAARAAPHFDTELDTALRASIEDSPKLDGHTIVLVDVSASMDTAKVSRRSELSRMDAAAALASVIPSDNLRVFSFSAGPNRYAYSMSNNRVLVECPPRRGLSGIDAVVNSQYHGGTMIGQAVHEAKQLPHDRLIVVTDEQSHDRVPDPKAPLAYMINVASNKNGVGYGRWTHIDGFSESVLRFIYEHESALRM